MKVTSGEINLRVYTRVSEEVHNKEKVDMVAVVNELMLEYPFVERESMEGGVKKHWVEIVRANRC